VYSSPKPILLTDLLTGVVHVYSRSYCQPVWSAIGMIPLSLCLLSVCQSVCLRRSVLWLKVKSYNKSVWASELEILRNTRFYLYIYHIPRTSHPNIKNTYYISLSWLRDHLVYVATSTCERIVIEVIIIHRTQYERLSQQQLGFLFYFVEDMLDGWPLFATQTSRQLPAFMNGPVKDMLGIIPPEVVWGSSKLTT